MRSNRRSNPAASMLQVKQSILDALRALRAASREAREGSLFAASGTLRTVGMNLSPLFEPETLEALTRQVEDPTDFMHTLRDVRDSFGTAQSGILYGTLPRPPRNTNAMVGALVTLEGDIEGIYVMLFNSRPPKV